MKIGPRNEEDSLDINITPLIDVVFLLLIFFMVSTTFARKSEIEIELPEASAQERQEPPESIEINIDAQGRYYVGGRQLVNTRAETLRRALKARAGNPADGKPPPIVISADGKAPHQAVITAMDQAQRLGLTHITFATTIKAEDGS